MDKPFFDWVQINPVLSVAVGSAVSAQILKFLLYIGLKRRARFERLVGAGGMPSSHAAMITAVVSAVGHDYGWNTPLFAMSAVFGLIVLYDAVGVRQTVGLHSRYLNRWTRQQPETMTERPFLENVGHTPIEVVAGMAWGILWAFWL